MDSNTLYIRKKRRLGLEDISQQAFDIVLKTIYCKDPVRRNRRIEQINPILRKLLSGRTSLFASDSEWIAQDLMWQILACMEDMALELKRKEENRRKDLALFAEQKAEILKMLLR